MPAGVAWCRPPIGWKAAIPPHRPVRIRYDLGQIAARSGRRQPDLKLQVSARRESRAGLGPVRTGWSKQACAACHTHRGRRGHAARACLYQAAKVLTGSVSRHCEPPLGGVAIKKRQGLRWRLLDCRGAARLATAMERHPVGQNVCRLVLVPSVRRPPEVCLGLAAGSLGPAAGRQGSGGSSIARRAAGVFSLKARRRLRGVAGHRVHGPMNGRLDG